MLQTDLSRLDLDYALLQRHGTKWKLIQCGSRFLSDVESRYTPLEPELFAAVCGMKCRMYLFGLSPFGLVIDHKPLTAIFNNHTLDAIKNLRLQQLKDHAINLHSRLA